MRVPWWKLLEVLNRSRMRRQEKPKLLTCPVDGTELYQARPDLQICARGHRFGPNEPRGPLINQGEHHGEI